MIDLRSDTVAPSEAMRRAMAEAEVGDELFVEDPTARRLEDYAAHLLGKPASLFVPTCTMGNAVALLAHGRVPLGDRGVPLAAQGVPLAAGSQCEADFGCLPERVLMDVQAHIHRREMHPPSTLGALRPTFFDSPDGGPSVEDVRRFADNSSEPGLVCLETTHTWRSGHAISLARLREISAEARRHRLPIHLDGARMLHAAAMLDADPADLAAGADSVVMSLCKGIGAPIGGILAGSVEYVASARKILYALGGMLRMTGMLAAAGLMALETGRGGLKRDFANAQRLARAMAGFGVRVEDFTSNVVLFDPSPFGLCGAEFAELARKSGVQVLLLDANLVRLTTHPGLSDAQVDEAADVLTRIVERK